MKSDKRKTVVDEVTSSLRRFIDSDASVHVCLAEYGETSTADSSDVVAIPRYHRLETSKELAEQFGGMATAVFSDILARVESGNLRLHKYKPGTKLDPDEMEYIDLSENAQLETVVAGLTDLAEIPAFDAASDDIASLRFYAIRLELKGGKTAIAFRSYSPKKELGRSPIIAAILRNGYYDRITESTFLFDQYIDCIASDGKLLVLNKDKFQRIFHFYEILFAQADTILRKIHGAVPIQGFDEFRESCLRHLHKVSKLHNIASKPYLATLTMARMRKVIRTHGLDIEIQKDGSTESLVYNPSDKWAILRLLDDDYLGSDLTDLKYEVNSKREI